MMTEQHVIHHLAGCVHGQGQGYLGWARQGCEENISHDQQISSNMIQPPSREYCLHPPLPIFNIVLDLFSISADSIWPAARLLEQEHQVMGLRFEREQAPPCRPDVDCLVWFRGVTIDIVVACTYHCPCHCHGHRLSRCCCHPDHHWLCSSCGCGWSYTDISGPRHPIPLRLPLPRLLLLLPRLLLPRLLLPLSLRCRHRCLFPSSCSYLHCWCFCAPVL